MSPGERRAAAGPGRRRAWLLLHRHVGLWLGMVLSLIGVTGSLLVFDHALDEALNPQFWTAATAEGPHLPLQDLIAAAARALPDGQSPSDVSLPRVPGGAVLIYAGPAEDRYALQVTVDPVVGRVLGQRPTDEPLMAVVYDLHYTLLAGDTGFVVVGLCGIALLVGLVSGVVVWWPRGGKWRQAFGIKRGASGARLTVDLHRTHGIYALPVLAVVAFSGVYMVFPEWITPAVSAVSPVTPLPQGLRSAPAGGRTPL
ncbi:MAG: PepSY domain-containing protein [Caenispirillum sp.]|nr:PepSY domain-containing protein [Caenispirillum sp.]